MTNKGAAPFDPSTAVGHMRLNIGDTASQPLNPVESGFADYAFFSDVALNTFLTVASGSILRATGYAIRQLALDAALQGRSVRTNDLAIDSTKRGDSLNAIADSWIAEADAQDQNASFFEVLNYNGFPTH